MWVVLHRSQVLLKEGTAALLRLTARMSKLHCKLKSKAVKMKQSLTAENKCKDIYTSRFPRSSTWAFHASSTALHSKQATPLGSYSVKWYLRVQLTACPCLCWQGGGLRLWPLFFSGQRYQLFWETENAMLIICCFPVCQPYHWD